MIKTIYCIWNIEKYIIIIYNILWTSITLVGLKAGVRSFIYFSMSIKLFDKLNVRTFEKISEISWFT